MQKTVSEQEKIQQGLNEFIKEQLGGDFIQVKQKKATFEIPEEEFNAKTMHKTEGQFDKEISDFKLLARIGGGAFGTVYLGQLKDNEKEFYAVKAMSKAKMVENDMVDMAVLE